MAKSTPPETIDGQSWVAKLQRIWGIDFADLDEETLACAAGSLVAVAADLIANGELDVATTQGVVLAATPIIATSPALTRQLASVAARVIVEKTGGPMPSAN